MIIDSTIFQGEITLGQAESFAVKEEIQWFIDKYEPTFLKLVLGVKLYEDLMAGLEGDPVEPKWETLEKLLKCPLANFVYCKYMRNKISETSGSGETLHNADVAARVSPLSKIVRAWNEMVDLLDELRCRFHSAEFKADYPEYCPAYRYRKTNSFGL
jgi:hypothetical protein